MKIHVPDEIAHYEPDLRYVFETMVRKLYVNRHKGFADGVGFMQALGLIHNEVAELETALLTESQMAFFGEAVDVANTGLIAALVALRCDKATFIGEKEEHGKQRTQTSPETEHGSTVGCSCHCETTISGGT